MNSDGTKRKRRKSNKPKTVSKKKFLEAYEMYIHGEGNLDECSVVLGVSRPTFAKWANQYYECDGDTDQLRFIKKRKSRSVDGKSGPN